MAHEPLMQRMHARPVRPPGAPARSKKQLLPRCCTQGDPTHQMQLRGHDGEITAFALSVSGCMRRATHQPRRAPANLVHAPSSCVHVQQQHNPNLRHTPVPPRVQNSGALLASAQRGFNCDVVIWDAAALAQRSRFQEHDVEVVAVGFSPDDRLLATIGCETCVGVLCCWRRRGRVWVVAAAAAQVAVCLFSRTSTLTGGEVRPTDL